MPDKNQSPLDTVLELARQNVLAKGEAEINELADERKRQLDAIEKVEDARDEVEIAFDNLPPSPGQPGASLGVNQAAREREEAVEEARAQASQAFTDIINA